MAGAPAPHADRFWEALHERWRAATAEREQEAVRATLVHLRRRLTGPEAAHLDEKLPRELRELCEEPAVEAHRPGQRPVERLDYEGFLRRVQRDAELTSSQEAEQVTRAVLHALGRVLDPGEHVHLANILPKGLKERWVEEAGVPPGGSAPGTAHGGVGPRAA